MDQAAVKQQVADSVHEIKVEINRVEHGAIRARQVLEPRMESQISRLERVESKIEDEEQV